MAKFISDEEMVELEAKYPPQPKKFISDEDMLKMEESSKVSKLESGARGLAQGATMGFADEIVGGLGALYDMATNRADQGFKESYTKHRDESRANNQAAQEANPITYGGANMAGAVGTAFVPGLGGATLGRLAAQGAAHGLGSSDADLTEGNLADAAKDTAIGGALGAAGGAVGKAVGALGKRLSQNPTVQGGAKDITRSRPDYGQAKSFTTQNKKWVDENVGEEMSDILRTSAAGETTWIGKRFNDLQKAELRARKIGNIPEELGASGELVGLSTIPKRVQDIIKDPFSHGSTSSHEFARKGLLERTKDTAVGSGKILGTGLFGDTVAGGLTGGAGTGLALKAIGGSMGAKVAGAGLKKLNDGVFKLADAINKDPAVLERMGKYAGVLTEAMRRGGQSLMVTDYLLQQSDPEYRQVIRQMQDEVEDEQ